MLLAVLVVFAFMDTGAVGKQISSSQAVQMLENGEISAWYAQENNSVKIRKKDSEIPEDKFPASADYYFEYTEISFKQFYDATITNNKGKTETDPGYIKFNIVPQGASIWSILLPILYILMGLFLIYFIFRMFSNSNKGAMNFGKSRTKTSANIKVRFTDIAGADEEKQELSEIVEFLKNPEKFTSLGARIPKGVLLVGPPGTGKTLLARAVAGESNVPFLTISGSDFVEMFVGVGASRVRDLFEQAKKASPCIVFIDEIDAVGRQRGAGLGGGNDEREQTLNQLLVEMDGFESNEGIIVLAATNRSDVLDPALLRPGRFDRQIYVHVPDVKGREGIIKIHAKNKPLDDDIDFKTLARITSGFTGADIENMLNEAAILAARANRPKIIMQDLTEGINKVLMGPQKKSWLITERDKKITAYHEAGHAILAKKLEYSEEVQEVSIIPRGNAAGYTMSRPDSDDSHMTFNKLNDRIAELMGGRISEEIIFKDISTGASNDIKQATNIATKMVTEWGMSKLGFIEFGTDQEVFIGRDYQAKNTYSEKTAGEIDGEIRRILDENYKRAKKILTENKNLLDGLAELLLAKETIYKSELDMLLAGKTKDQIVRHMDNEVRKRKKKEEEVKREFELINKAKESEIKFKTAQVFLKNGIIKQTEFDRIAENHKQTLAELQRHKDEKLQKTTYKKVIEVKDEPAEKKPRKQRAKKSETKQTEIIETEKTPKQRKPRTKKIEEGEDK